MNVSGLNMLRKLLKAWIIIIIENIIIPVAMGHNDKNFSCPIISGLKKNKNFSSSKFNSSAFFHGSTSGNRRSGSLSGAVSIYGGFATAFNEQDLQPGDGAVGAQKRQQWVYSVEAAEALDQWTDGVFHSATENYTSVGIDRLCTGCVLVNYRAPCENISDRNAAV